MEKRGREKEREWGEKRDRDCEGERGMRKEREGLNEDTAFAHG